MNIQFNHEEIVQAVVDYTKKRGIDLSSSAIEVTLTAGRGSNGYSAHVEILANNLTVKEATDMVMNESEETVETEDDTSEEVVEEDSEGETADNKSLFAN